MGQAHCGDKPESRSGVGAQVQNESFEIPHDRPSSSLSLETLQPLLDVEGGLVQPKNKNAARRTAGGDHRLHGGDRRLCHRRHRQEFDLAGFVATRSASRGAIGKLVWVLSRADARWRWVRKCPDSSVSDWQECSASAWRDWGKDPDGKTRAREGGIIKDVFELADGTHLGWGILGSTSSAIGRTIRDPPLMGSPSSESFLTGDRLRRDLSPGDRIFESVSAASGWRRTVDSISRRPCWTVWAIDSPSRDAMANSTLRCVSTPTSPAPVPRSPGTTPCWWHHTGTHSY